jgi:6,7-dimethyl-8-ribityllumazine synthase
MTQRIAFIQSQWHGDIVAACRDAFLDEAARLGRPSTQVDVFDVPGAYEIP